MEGTLYCLKQMVEECYKWEELMGMGAVLDQGRVTAMWVRQMEEGETQVMMMRKKTEIHKGLAAEELDCCNLLQNALEKQGTNWHQHQHTKQDLVDIEEMLLDREMLQNEEREDKLTWEAGSHWGLGLQQRPLLHRD